MPVICDGEEIWSFDSAEELNQEATSCLRSAMIFERRKRWHKVIECYERLLWLVDLKHFPSDYKVPKSYDMLLYEIRNHLGVAYQHIGEHRKAIGQYSKAFEIVSIPKNGCLAGCVTNSCLMTPIMTRRAFAYSKVGNMTKALKDAEKAVVLDTKNPDVYCIRALVHGSRDEENMALHDIELALKINPNNVPALMIRSAINRPLSEKMNSSTQNISSVTNFQHPNILEFFDRYFFTLSVPHTITEINVTALRSASTNAGESHFGDFTSVSRQERIRPKTAYPDMTFNVNSNAVPPNSRPFRCGTAVSHKGSTAPDRRKEYGKAVRQYMTRPKTASDFIALLEKERKKKAEMEMKLNMSLGNRKSFLNSRMSSHKTFASEPHHMPTIPVFQQIDLKNTSRMYYKPWKGDKLPVADIKKIQPLPAFY